MAKSKITVNNFFHSSRDYKDNELTSGNAWRSKGWVSVINYSQNLVIQTMPQETFMGFIWNSNSDHKTRLEGDTIMKIISSANQWLKENS